MKFAYQGIPGSYSESCIKENYPDCENTISCRTFQDAFELAKNNNNVKALVPEQNQLIGSINIETLILKYRLNIVAEHFFKINHSLLGIPGTRLKDIKNVYVLKDVSENMFTDYINTNCINKISDNKNYKKFKINRNCKELN